MWLLRSSSETLPLLDDEGLQALAELVVLHADHRGLGHVLVLLERLLDLLGIDVLAARDDHVVGAALDEQAPLLVEVAEVAGGHVAVHHLLALAAGVALEQHRVAHEDLAGLARPALALVLLVEDLERGAGRRRAARARRVAQVLGLGDRRPGHLGRAVEVVEVVAELVHPLLGELARQRAAAGGHDAQRGEVVLAPRRRRARSRMRCSITGTITSAVASFSSIAASVASGSNLRRST